MRVAATFALAFAVSFAIAVIGAGCGARSEDEASARSDAEPSQPSESTAAPTTNLGAASASAEPSRVNPSPDPEYTCGCPEPWRTPIGVEFEIDQTFTTGEAGESVSPAVAMTSGTIELSADGELLVRYDVDGARVEVTYAALSALAK